MSPLPRRSAGVLCATLGEMAIAYDLVTETRHRLNASAAAVLQECDGLTSRASAIDSWAAVADTDPHLVSKQVDMVLERFAELGLVGRDQPWTPPQQSIGATHASAASTLGASHGLLGRSLRFRSSSRELLERIDAYLGTGSHASQATIPSAEDSADSAVIFEVEPLPSGGVRLTTEEVTTYHEVDTMLSDLVALTSRRATETHICVAVHAAAARSPLESIALLPAVSGAGKSSLTGVLIAAGWDYLGDDVVGLDHDGIVYGFPKRISLDYTSRSLLGLPRDADSLIDPSDIRDNVVRLSGRVGPPAVIVFPEYEPGAASRMDKISPFDSLDALLEQTINLARTGQQGLETLCAIVESIDSYRFTYGDAINAATDLTELVDTCCGAGGPTALVT